MDASYREPGTLNREPGPLSLFGAFCAAICILLMAFPGRSAPPGHDPKLPNFDKREGKGKERPARPWSGPQAAALDDLRKRVPDVKVERHTILGTPKHVASLSGFLSGANAEGGALPPARSLDRRPGDGPHRAIKGFLNAYQPLFGHGAEVLEQAQLMREVVTAHNGLHTVVWEQRLDDIAVYEGVLIGNLSARDELISLSSQFVPQPARAAEAGTPGRAAILAAPPVAAADALLAAAETLDEAVDPAQIVALNPRPEGREQRQRFKLGTLPGEARARLVWLPLSAYSLRLCWDTELTRQARNERYRVLVDALNGEVLVRQRLTLDISDATFAVFTSDSPRPFSPGWSTPNTNQPPPAARSLVTLSALRTNASLIGWISDGENETRGNNVDAHLDRNGDDVPDLPRPQGSPFRVFQPPLDLGRDPEASGDAA
ncbi:MAG TPA: hypothetical protein VNM37_27545, partial [Candidatus Dormibacteraeota bacterium]|nr:hypothetical protein [Candidatus Dormibacteraeota bacterium]